MKDKKYKGISRLFSLIYLLANVWIILNVNSLSFTANDPTLVTAIGGMIGELN